MHKAIYIIIALLGTLAPHSVQGQIRFLDLSLEDAIAQAKSTNKQVFIDFRADWCKPCVEMELETFSNKKVGKSINENFIPIKVDVDYFEGMDIKEKYNVSVLPTILIIDGYGDVQRRLMGKKTPSSLMSELDLSYSGGGDTTSSPEYPNEEIPTKNNDCKLKKWWNRITN